MHTPIVSMNDLSFSYTKGSKILQNISLEVKAGQIYGFLGPNGSGKTTTLRLLLGLLKKQEGSIKIFGKDIQTSRIEILKEIGSLIENPSVYGHLTANQNLEVYREIYNCKKGRLDEVLHTVGLADVGGKAVKNYSLGMKQRLSIALALLPGPKLLILDEPTNGLDPTGIIELRQLIKNLNKEHGMSIIISSHNLSEVEKIVSHVGIIFNGKMLFQGALDELYDVQKAQTRVLINTSDNDRVIQLLHDKDVQRDNNMLSFAFEGTEEMAAINRTLLNSNIDLYHLQRLDPNLEQLFIALTTKS
ncbi:ABC transporter ATP-binding protein [Mucilaginibacter terrigena]|uniref:ABC transporter ATP-binding protein n=1 Tax=Mucilaginibacter terrigena TaxID=2492395 RepID=A0A4V1ZC48_9SPHI|nr:ABC transporter ATP-binding protein [Mucilaginibacter terrigena]RYU91410.1 ABC transporter ATP-binding protein [Mucilaginibacter terrigena]